MVTTLVIAVLTCVFLILSVLIFPKIKIGKISINTYWIVCLIGAILMVLFRVISFDDIYYSLTIDSSINPLKILILFFSMTLLSIFLDEVGFFKFLATRAASLAKTNQLILFVILYFLTSFLTIFTSNDIVILTFTPFICYFCKNASIDAKPYLVAEFAAANTWSMMLIIGNPTNIYLATSANIDFISYVKVMAIPTIVSGLVELAIIYLLFRKSLKKPMSLSFEKNSIEDKIGLCLGLTHLGICLVLLVISSYINFDMYLIALLCVVSLFVFVTIANLLRRQKFTNLLSALKRAPYDLIPFIISMFIIVEAINKQGITSYITQFLGTKDVVLRYGFASLALANVINNIPMSVLFSMIPQMNCEIDNLRAIYATIIGSNIGAFLSPIGALAGIMFTQLLAKYNINYGYKNFIKYGFIIALPTIASALLILMIIL